MNHWDLNPGETVTLVRSYDRKAISAGFRFRTTTIAAFLHEDDRGKLRLVEFRLRDDGALEKEQNNRDALFDRTRVRWSIAEKRENTRGIAREED